MRSEPMKMDYDLLVRSINAGGSELAEFRNQHERAWPTPGQRDASAFVLTESAETMLEAAALLVRFQFEDQGERASSFALLAAVGRSVDAELRARGGYTRNRDRTVDFTLELADVYMMLLTAYNQPVDPAGGNWYIPESFDKLTVSVLNSIVHVLMRYGSRDAKIRAALFDVSSYMIAVLNVDPNELLRARLDRIAKKLKG